MIEKQKDKIEHAKAENERIRDNLNHPHKIATKISDLKQEIDEIQTNIASLTAMSDPDAHAENACIQADISNLIAQKRTKDKELLDFEKRFEFAKLEVYNLHSLLKLRRHSIPDDFSDIVGRQKAEMARLENEYSEELAKLGNPYDRRKQALMEKEIKDHEREIEGYKRFNEDISQGSFEEIERQLTENLERAKDSFRDIQQEVERMTQKPIQPEDPSAALEHLRSLHDDAMDAWEQSKDAIRKYDLQIEQVRGQNADLSRRVGELQLILELQRRQQEDHQANNPEDSEKMLLKIHEFNLDLIKNDAEIRMIEDKIQDAKENTRRQEESYMILFVVGSFAYYLYQIMLLF